MLSASNLRVMSAKKCEFYLEAGRSELDEGLDHRLDLCKCVLYLNSPNNGTSSKCYAPVFSIQNSYYSVQYRREETRTIM